MPKRICPFPYDLLPQQKIHLSEKEVFTTIESQKQVHNKTIAMLFNGARSTLDRVAPSSESTSNPQPSTSASWDRKRQLYLNSECQLVDRCVENNEATCRSDIACECTAWRSRNATSSVSCGSCDRRVCLDCITGCQQCGGDVCKSCVQAIYVCSDRYVCRDCS